jgi:hypothetical protein
MSDNVEISFNIKAESLVEFSLSWFLPLITIDDIELLVDLSMSLPYNNVSVFSINATLNVKDLSSNVLDDSSFSHE